MPECDYTLAVWKGSGNWSIINAKVWLYSCSMKGRRKLIIIKARMWLYSCSVKGRRKLNYHKCKCVIILLQYERAAETELSQMQECDYTLAVWKGSGNWRIINARVWLYSCSMKGQRKLKYQSVIILLQYERAAETEVSYMQECDYTLAMWKGEGLNYCTVNARVWSFSCILNGQQTESTYCPGVIVLLQ